MTELKMFAWDPDKPAKLFVDGKEVGRIRSMTAVFEYPLGQPQNMTSFEISLVKEDEDEMS